MWVCKEVKSAYVGTGFGVICHGSVMQVALRECSETRDDSDSIQDLAALSLHLLKMDHAARLRLRLEAHPADAPRYIVDLIRDEPATVGLASP